MKSNYPTIAINCKFTLLFCIVLNIALTVNVHSQNVEPNLRVIISTVNDTGERQMITKDSLEFGEAVQIKVEITNLSNKIVEVPEGMVYSRPILFNNGQLVSYNKEASNRFKKGKYITLSRNILPNQSRSEIIDLSNYYESLEPGQYQLSLARRFFNMGSVESNAVTFKISDSIYHYR